LSNKSSNSEDENNKDGDYEDDDKSVQSDLPKQFKPVARQIE